MSKMRKPWGKPWVWNQLSVSPEGARYTWLCDSVPPLQGGNRFDTIPRALRPGLSHYVSSELPTTRVLPSPRGNDFTWRNRNHFRQWLYSVPSHHRSSVDSKAIAPRSQNSAMRERQRRSIVPPQALLHFSETTLGLPEKRSTLKALNHPRTHRDGLVIPPANFELRRPR